MEIQLYRKEVLLKTFPIDDNLLLDIPYCSREANFKKREAVIKTYILAIKHSNPKLFELNPIDIYISVRSKMRGKVPESEPTKYVAGFTVAALD